MKHNQHTSSPITSEAIVINMQRPPIPAMLQPDDEDEEDDDKQDEGSAHENSFVKHRLIPQKVLCCCKPA